MTIDKLYLSLRDREIKVGILAKDILVAQPPILIFIANYAKGKKEILPHIRMKKSLIQHTFKS
jgi:hypothetical protein